jgi:Ca-activated chloride channel family protein
MRDLSKPFALILAGLLSGSSLAQTPPPDDRDRDAADVGSIVVTGMRVRQGGAQDIGHFRQAAADGQMPRPESLTVEGLMGEHDLALETHRQCAQLLCLDAEAMSAAIPSRPDDRIFVGLTFASNVDPATWHRAPLNLVAVVDKSGSMDGEPLDLVRRSLRQIVGQMHDGDQLSIVLYGDESYVHLAPTPIAGGGRDKILKGIDAIASAGSTYMEAGLKVGYATAFASAPHFTGNTRLMLFTDEQPNVGATNAESFMGMAEAASRRGIGLTTIGVGVQFDGALAGRVSSVRGGNLFFIADEAQVGKVFEKQLDTMVSELAHDVRITMRPLDGYRITGVFGVPDGLMSDAGDGAVSVTVPTAFLSTNGGGIFASVGKARARANLPAASLPAGARLLDVELAYVGAADGRRGADRLSVGAPGAAPSAPLRLAQLLVDEYQTLKQASIAFHHDGDPKAAFRLLSGIQGRIDQSGLGQLDGERKLVAQMLEPASLYSGYGGEPPKAAGKLALLGGWRVSRADSVDLRPGDELTFTEQDVTVARRGRGNNLREDEPETYRLERGHLILDESKLSFDYRLSRTRLTLAGADGLGNVELQRVAGGTD